MKSENIIHAALAIYDPKGTYSQHAGVVMASIFDNTKSPVCVHILHDETLTERNRSFLTETAEIFSQKVEFHDVSAYIKQLGDETILTAQEGGWSIGTLFRLVIPDALPLDKIIYLDCDVVVNMDILELWDISVENCSCAGVLDVPHRRFSPAAIKMRLMGCDRKIYVNAGVLLMNLSRIRKKYQLIQQSVLWSKRYRHCFNLPDQDFINSCFQGDIKILEGRFNNCNAHRSSSFNNNADSSGISNSILHAILSPKSWECLRDSPADRLYWKFFLKTPWGRLSAEELMDMMIDVVQKSPLTHRRTGQCYGKIFHRLRKDVLYNGIAAVLWLLSKDLYYRIKRAFQTG